MAQPFGAVVSAHAAEFQESVGATGVSAARLPKAYKLDSSNARRRKRGVPRLHFLGIPII
jgi:hypothetical protein